MSGVPNLAGNDKSWPSQIGVHEQWPSIRQTSQSNPVLLLGVALIAACGAMLVDIQISHWCMQNRLPGEVRRFLRLGEMYSHGLGVVLIAALIYQLDSKWRKALPLVLFASLGAGLIADIIKLMVGRMRPRAFDFHGDAWSTFTGLFPMLAGGSDVQSFPSAHVAVAGGLTVALCRLYPQARGLFIVLGITAAFQRVAVGAHYLSDVLIGGALGIVVAHYVCNAKRLWIPFYSRRPENQLCTDASS